MITLAEAKSHLRVDNDDEDADITLKLAYAVAIVEAYAYSLNDQWQSGEVADAATLMVLGELYLNREASAAPLSATVKGILDIGRSPSFA